MAEQTKGHLKACEQIVYLDGLKDVVLAAYDKYADEHGDIQEEILTDLLCQAIEYHIFDRRVAELQNKNK